MNIKINNKIVEVEKGQSLLTAIRSTGIKIPTLCHLENLFPSGACRLCVVELENGSRLIPSCSVEVEEGMSIKTHSPKVLNARKTILELLLASHPDDCLYCNKNGTCELQKLAEELGVTKRSYRRTFSYKYVDSSSPSIMRDPAKCILCGRCVRVCEEIQGISAIDFIKRGSNTFIAPAFDEGLNISSCVNCGQCVIACPTGALVENNNIKDVLNAINDPDKFVVIQHAPSISVTIGEYFGYNDGVDVCGKMNSALKYIGFDKVFDTSFAADLTIMEEASELVSRIKNHGTLPMFTSCSPAWIKFVETFYPEFIANLSTCKSPQQMLGSLIKSYYAEKENIDPSKIYSVSVMPCTAKKFEAGREEMSDSGFSDVDASITTKELAKLFKMLNIDISKFTPSDADSPLGERTSAGKIFGVTGGVTEAAVRTAYFLITGENMTNPTIESVRNLNGIKEASVKIQDLEVKVAVVSGLGNARKLLDDIKLGKSFYHFVEIMSCPNGCIAGGGQPSNMDLEKVKSRMKSLYEIDNSSDLRFSHQNKSIQKLYNNFLGKPLGEKSHKLLHTNYQKRCIYC